MSQYFFGSDKRKVWPVVAEGKEEGFVLFLELSHFVNCQIRLGAVVKLIVGAIEGLGRGPIGPSVGVAIGVFGKAFFANLGELSIVFIVVIERFGFAVNQLRSHVLCRSQIGFVKGHAVGHVIMENFAHRYRVVSVFVKVLRDGDDIRQVNSELAA